MLAEIRAFFSRRGVLEVDTPMLSAHGATDPHLHSLHSRPQVAGRRMYWHTSPELAMKRLLAVGSGPIYQLCHVFRDGEVGRLHNLEFTLLEWYRPFWDHHALMDEVAELVQASLGADRELADPERLSYREAWLRHTDVDPFEAAVADFRSVLAAAGASGGFPDDMDRDAWLDLVMSHCIAPQLGRDGCCFVYDYPASQAALARLNPQDPRTAARFELYLDGIELANGYWELTDPREQARRFAADNRKRRALGLPSMPGDCRLLAALEAGLADCAGVALGVDRLLMLATGAGHIEEVMAFVLGRA